MENRGFAFGLGEGLPTYFYLILLWAVVVALWRRWLSEWGWWLIFLGGVLNTWERLNRGFVLDDWRFLNFNLWFNLADMMISFGVMAVIYQMYRNGKRAA